MRAVTNFLPERTVIVSFAVYGIIAAAITLAYFPGLSGPFVFDDISNIVHNSAIQISHLGPSSLYAAAASSPSSALGRPLATLSFAVNYLIAGGLANVFAFKLVNLVIHLANTALVYWLVLLLLRQHAKPSTRSTTMSWVPALVAASWGLHPLNLTSVLYVVQRMTSLSALFVLLGLILFIYGRRRIHEQKRHGMTLIVAGWFTGLVLGTSAKETAVLILLYIPLIETIFFSRSDFRSASATSLRLFYRLAIALPLLAILVWALMHPGFIQESYKIRDFDMAERLLTEPRVLWFYLYLLFVPDITKFSLYHDDITISTGLFTPWTTVPAILTLLALTVTAIVGRKKYPIFSFAILWFLVGHSLESSILPLEIAHEHRNYLPAIGPLLALFYALATVFAGKRPLFQSLCAMMLVLLASATFLRAQTWADDGQLITTMVRHHPRSPRAQAMLAELYAIRRGDLVQAQKHYEAAAALDPGETSYSIRILINGEEISSLENNGDQKSTAVSESGPYHTFDRASISTHIKDQLASKALTPTTMLVLQDLTEQFVKTPRRFHDIYPYTLDWFRAILRNPNASHDVQTAAFIYLFQISSAMDDRTTALDTAVTARSRDPANVSFALMEADARIAMHQLSQAEEILLRVRRDAGQLSPDSLNGVNILLTKIRNIRNDSAKP